MFSIRERLCATVTILTTALLSIAVLTAGTTILRTTALRPQPVAHGLEVRASVVYSVEMPTLIMEDTASMVDRMKRQHANSNTTSTAAPTNEQGLVWDSPYAVNGVLDSNVRLLTSQELERADFGRYRLPPGAHAAIRSMDRVLLYASGMIDFSSSWDWNTKAIYVSLVARYATSATAEHPAMPQNEVTFVDAVIRPATLPRALHHLRGKNLADMSPEEGRAFLAFARTLRNPQHDHETIFIDHVNKRLYLNNTIKYVVDDFYRNTLDGEGITVVVRYQVMSYSGWAPLREDVLYGTAHVMLGHERQAWSEYVKDRHRQAQAGRSPQSPQGAGAHP